MFILMLGSAIFHMAVLAVHTLISGDWYALNYFNILDFDFFLPIGRDVAGNIAAGLLPVALYLAILFMDEVKKP